MNPYAPFAIIGQASSQHDEGRVFPGPSGRRLVELLGFGDYVDLWSKTHLQNLFEEDEEVDAASARRRGRGIIDAMVFMNKQTQVIACGFRVFWALTGRRDMPYYKGLRLRTPLGRYVDVWCFPHPSDENEYWHNPLNVEQASIFIKKAYRRAAVLDER